MNDMVSSDHALFPSNKKDDKHLRMNITNISQVPATSLHDNHHKRIQFLPFLPAYTQFKLVTLSTQ